MVIARIKMKASFDTHIDKLKKGSPYPPKNPVNMIFSPGAPGRYIAFKGK
jgi:hypothetical protein